MEASHPSTSPPAGADGTGDSSPDMAGVAVLIPVKAFDRAKVRLTPALEPHERARLARAMATHVVRSASPLPVAVVCDDGDVAAWVETTDAQLLWTPGTGLNGAVTEGVQALGDQGFTQVVVAHSDLPLASGFEAFSQWPGVTIAPDRHGTGTNVLAVHPSTGFEFSYGTGSFRRHVIEATRLRRGLRIVHSMQLAWDVDFPDDLSALEATSFLP